MATSCSNVKTHSIISSSLMVPPPSLSLIMNSMRLKSLFGSHLASVQVRLAGSSRKHSLSCGPRKREELHGKTARITLSCPCGIAHRAAQSFPSQSSRHSPRPLPKSCLQLPRSHNLFAASVCNLHSTVVDQCAQDDVTRYRGGRQRRREAGALPRMSNCWAISSRSIFPSFFRSSRSKTCSSRLLCQSNASISA